MKYDIEFKNLFKTIPELQKIFYHIKHYIDKMNIAKTGCFFLYNLDMLLYNVSVFKNTLKKSTKKADKVLYYPFFNKSFPSLILNDFVDFKNNKDITTSLEEFRPNLLVAKINKNIEKLNNDKLSKEELVDIFEIIEHCLWVLNKCYKIYAKKYEDLNK